MILYLFTNFLMNFVTRFSIQSIGGLETIIWLGWYSLLAVVLYGAMSLLQPKFQCSNVDQQKFVILVRI